MQFFEASLLAFFKKQGRHALPWRKPNLSAYEIWVSEVMLQQTQVSRVIDYYQRFLEKFPTVFHLAQSSWDDFLPYYAGLGYYRRGQNMLKTAKKIVDECNGEFPRDKKILTTFPGIGDYTASAILSFAYDDDHLAFDTNLQKVFGRFLYGDKKAKIDQNALEKRLTSDKKTLNAALMDFSNLICLKSPKCLDCPIQSKCQYYLEKGRNEAISLKIKNSFPTKDVQVYLWLHKEHKEYYSPNPDQFEVFILSAPINTREMIKEHFRKNYKLELAVRPPHKKIMIQSVPTLFINAQILQGEHSFGVFQKAAVHSVFPPARNGTITSPSPVSML